MCVEIIHIDQDAIDDPRHPRPRPGALAELAMMPGAFVIRRRAGEHNETVARFHFTVRQSPVRRGHPGALPESERPGQPIERGHAVEGEFLLWTKDGNNGNWTYRPP